MPPERGTKRRGHKKGASARRVARALAWRADFQDPPVLRRPARPLGLVVTAGQCADVTHMLAVLDAIRVPRLGRGCPRKRPTALRVDRACGSPASRRALTQRGIRCICPERRDSRRHRLARGCRGGRPPDFDAQAYKGRNVVERCITDSRTSAPSPSASISTASTSSPVSSWPASFSGSDD